jgi:hypothetical protein
MLARRSVLAQIIALGVAPAIIRVAPLMKIKPILDYGGYRSLGDFETAIRGVVINPLYGIGDAHGCLLIARNLTNAPLKFGGVILRGGEELVLSKTLRPPIA